MDKPNDKLTREILRCAFKVHTTLGCGLLESVYQKCLAYELEKAGFRVEVEKSIPIQYFDITIKCSYRIDILVNESVILELKAVDSLTDVHEAQILTYMKFAHIKTGLLINFNVKSLRNGIKRFVR